MFTNKDIAKHFELCEEHYKNWWKLNKSKSMHYGYWDENTKNLSEALYNINKVMKDRAGITSNMNVLDAGCGVGGSSIWLGSHIGCSVIGISLSAKQVNSASKFAESVGLSEKVTFAQQDYCNTDFPNESFDIVWAIESVCYAKEKLDFLSEAYRLLKPGGKLIVADFFEKKGLTGIDKRQMAKMAYGWAINQFATIEDFALNASEAGFKNFEVDNISKQISPSAKRLFHYSYPGLLLTKIYDFLFNASELSKYHSRTINIQYPALKKGLWQYFLFLAEK